ncbi:hypothetical protein [Thermodesulfovibrio hydrogeniphilus]
MKRIFLCLILSLIFCSQTDAFDRKGFSPTAPFSVLSTFSADSPKQNQVALGIDYELATDPDIKRVNLNVSYGLTNNFELILNLPYNLSYKDYSKSSGAEDLNFGFKHRILEETTFTPAIAYMLFASGDFGKEAFSTAGGIGGGFIVSKKVGPVQAHGNLIYFRPEKEGFKEIWKLNLGAELKVSYNSQMLFEIIGRKAVDKNKIDLLEWRLGYRIKITDFSYTTVGVGFDIKNRNPDTRFMFGVSVILPPEKRKYKKVVDDVD